MTEETDRPAPPPPLPRARLLRGLAVVAVSLGLGFAIGFKVGHRADPPAAVVNGEAIPMSELDANLESRFAGLVLRDIVSQRLILQEARKQGIKIDPAEVEKRLQAMKDEPRAAALLRSGRISEDDLRRNLSTLLPLDALVLAGVTPDQEKKFFEEHKNELQSMHLRQIQVASREEAEELRKQIQAGADFAKVAQEHSLDPVSKEQGGDLGMLKSAELPPSVASVVVPLEPGKVSPVVQTETGYMLFQVVERKGDYNSLRNQTREAMANPKRVEFVEKLRNQAKIETKLPEGASASKSSGEGDASD